MLTTDLSKFHTEIRDWESEDGLNNQPSPLQATCQVQDVQILTVALSHIALPTVQLDLPKDNKKNVEDGIQKLTDTLIKSVEDSLKKKSEELMKL